MTSTGLKVFRTPKFHGYNVKFSSYRPQLLACATALNYGLSGPGALYIFDTQNEFVKPIRFDWKDSIFDVVWSETNENLLASASGDGSVQIWNMQTPNIPVSVLCKHQKEVYSLDWCQGKNEQLLATGSWDGTTIVWDMSSGVSLNVLNNHGPLVYSVSWSPQVPFCLATASGDGSLRIWDVNNPQSPRQVIKAHGDEVLSCSWNYFREGIIATSSVDGLIRGWDLRLPKQPVFQLIGHNYAVRKIKFSPHKESRLASVSYDYTTRIWDWDSPNPIKTFEHHKEFVYGLDFCDQIDGMLADCGWDENICVFSCS